jgi:plasmid maintenance system antidote protein VapI
MGQPSRKTVLRLRAEANRPEHWERVEGFSKLTRHVAIRLTPTLANGWSFWPRLMAQSTLKTWQSAGL